MSRVLALWCRIHEAGGADGGEAPGPERCERAAVLLEQRVVPRLEVVGPGLLAFPVRGAARYWGGEEALAARAAAVVAEAGVVGRCGIADTLFAAALAARRAGPAGWSVPAGRTAEFLAPYPVGVLGDPELARLLVRLGLPTLGGFAALPADRVPARFGPAGAAAHRRARGVEVRAPRHRTAGVDRTAGVAFEPPEPRLEPVVFRAKALAEEVHTGLRAAGLVCARVAIRVVLADGRRLSRTWRHEGLSALAVAERVRRQLTAWQETGAFAPETGGAVGWLGLVPEGLRAEEGRQGALFGPGTAGPREEVERVAARLQAMLGHEAVTRVELGGGRGPGEQVVRVPFGDRAPEAPAAPGPWRGRLPAPYPAEVYPRMRPARLVDAAGEPVGVSGRAALTAAPAGLVVGGGRAAGVTGWAGPWPVLEEWWEDGRSRRFARLQVATADGRAWLLVVCEGRWWAEACYG